MSSSDLSPLEYVQFVYLKMEAHSSSSCFVTAVRRRSQAHKHLRQLAACMVTAESQFACRSSCKLSSLWNNAPKIRSYEVRSTKRIYANTSAHLALKLIHNMDLHCSTGHKSFVFFFIWGPVINSQMLAVPTDPQSLYVLHIFSYVYFNNILPGSLRFSYQVIMQFQLLPSALYIPPISGFFIKSASILRNLKRFSMFYFESLAGTNSSMALICPSHSLSYHFQANEILQAFLKTLLWE